MIFFKTVLRVIQLSLRMYSFMTSPPKMINGRPLMIPLLAWESGSCTPVYQSLGICSMWQYFGVQVSFINGIGKFHGIVRPVLRFYLVKKICQSKPWWCFLQIRNHLTDNLQGLQGECIPLPDPSNPAHNEVPHTWQCLGDKRHQYPMFPGESRQDTLTRWHSTSKARLETLQFIYMPQLEVPGQQFLAGNLWTSQAISLNWIFTKRFSMFL